MSVFVLDRHQKPLMPCSEKRARLLLKRGRARIHKMKPFTIRLVDRTVEESELQPVAVKIDPGSKATGVALVREDGNGRQVVLHLMEIVHRGKKIRDALESRRGHRRRRRGKLRFREKRFDNRRRPEGWLPPSLQSRVGNVASWTRRLTALAPVGRAVVESVKFLTLSCQSCNIAKGARDVREFLANDPDRLEKIPTGLKRPLRDAAAVNATRFAIVRAIEDLGLPVERTTGGRTKFNRSVLGVPKTHALDAACAGEMAAIDGWEGRPTLRVEAMGRGLRQRMLPDSFGFPRGHRPRSGTVHGFRTGDMVRADVPVGKKTGIHVGRVAVRSTGSFNIRTADGTVQGIHHRHCRIIQRADGYANSALPPPTDQGTELLPSMNARVSARRM